MKLRFDESLSPRLVVFPARLNSLSPKVRFETSLLVPAIAGFWTRLPLTGSSWSRQTAISNVWRGRSLGTKVVILRSCDYLTDVAAEVLRRNAIRIGELPSSQDHLIILDQ